MAVRRTVLALSAVLALAGCSSPPATPADAAAPPSTQAPSTRAAEPSTSAPAPSPSAPPPPPPTQAPSPRAAEPSTPAPAPSPSAVPDQLPGMPPATDSKNVYAAAGAGMLSPVAKSARPMVYVPHNSGDVWEIDPATFHVVAEFPAGREVQHVVPSWDMKRLYATDDLGNSITPIDPRTGRPGARIPVEDPYNMYFTPDGKSAVSVAEARKQLVFYDPRTWAEQGRLSTPQCAGIDHADFTADGRTAVFSCEFAGRVAVVDVL